MKAVSRKATKEVTLIATYYHKNVETGELTGVVTYLVRASNGVDTYTTTLVDGKASGCSCAARGSCYHKKQLEQKAQERKEVAQQFAAKSAPSWLINLVSTGKLVTPKQNVELPAGVAPINGTLHVKGPAIVREATDISTKGALTTNRGFTLLKVS